MCITQEARRGWCGALEAERIICAKVLCSPASKMAPKCSLTHTLHSLVQSLPTLNRADLCNKESIIEVTECDLRGEVIKDIAAAHLFSWVTLSRRNQLSYCEDTEGALWRGSELSGRWTLQLQSSPQKTVSPADIFTTNSRRTLSQNCPAKLLPSLWPIETVRY